MEEIADEGIVLLENEQNLLPLAPNSNINVFGWASTNPVYGGAGCYVLEAGDYIISDHAGGSESVLSQQQQL